MVYTSMCLLLLCFGSSGGFITLKEMVRVVAFNLWPWGLQGWERGLGVGWGGGVRDRDHTDSIIKHPFLPDLSCSSSSVSYDSLSVLDIVHENLKMGSDGESDQASGTSSDEVQSPTGVCLRNRVHRRISMEVRSVCSCSQQHNNPVYPSVSSSCSHGRA